VTGTLNGNQVTIPDIYYSGEFLGRPQYSSAPYGLFWAGPYWNFNGPNLYSTGSASDAQSPELVTQWIAIGTEEPLITTLTLAKLGTSYEIGDVVTYAGSTWYCYTAYTFDPEAPEYPEIGSAYWQLIAAKGADGADGVAWNYTGEYSGGASYAVGDVATYDGELWYRTGANGGNVGDTPSDVSPFWDLLAAKGEDGDVDKLPLTGGAIVANSSSDALRITQTGSGNALVVEDSTNPDSTPFVIDANGNVSIGAPSFPSAKLFIQKPAGADANGEIRYGSGEQWTILNSNSAQGAYNPLVQSGDHSITWGDSSSTKELGSMVLVPWSDSPNGLRITNSGNVGIGTATPVDKLSVNGPIHIAPATTNYGALVDEANRTNTYLSLQGSAGQNDFAYLRQIGTGDNDLTISLDLHDDLNDPSGGQAFAIRNVPSWLDPDSTPITNFIVNANGNVGIGTATPTAKLDVAGSASINSSGYGFLRLGAADSTGWAVSKEISDNSFNLWAGGVQGSPTGNPVRITSTGNVGIGTATPEVKLDVAGEVKASSLYINNPSGAGDSRIEVGGAQNVYIDLKTPNSDDYDLRIAAGEIGNTIESITPLYINSTSNQQVSIASGGGNVGIGTLSPAAKLDVIGVASARSDVSTGNSPLVAVNTNSGNNTTKYTSVLLQGYDTVGSGKNTGLVMAGPSDADYVSSYMAFHTRSADSLSERMRITSGGDVGIGTGTPTAKLNVVDNSSSDALRITQTGSGNALVVEDSTNPDSTPFVVMANGNVGIGTAVPQGLLQVVAGASNSILLGGPVNMATGGTVFAADSINSALAPMELGASSFLFSGGNVGIGTATPEVKLEVAGEVKASSLYINNPSGSSKIEVGGAENVYIDLKTPYSDDYDLRIAAGEMGNGIESITPLYINPTSNQQVSIASGGGNVGIGTNTPTAKLNVVDNSSSDALRITQTGSGNALVVEDSTNPDATPFVIDANGNVGIGGSPSYRLDVGGTVVGSTAGDSISISRLSGDTGGNGVALQTTLNRISNGTTWETTALRVQAQVDVSPFGYIDFLNGSTAAMTFGRTTSEFMRITSAGNVGIGTIDPSAKLDIQKPAGADANGEIKCANGQQWTRLNSNSAAGAYNSLVQSGDHSIIWGDSSSALELGSMVIAPWSDSPNGLRITNSGDVGIGTATPTEKLDVAGGIRASSVQLNQSGNPFHAQVNPPSGLTSTQTFTLPTIGGTIATNNSAVMLTGNQAAIGGNKSFSGQMELTGQAATNPTSVMTRALGDARYGLGTVGNTFSSVNINNVVSADNVPITLASVTLPVGTYQIDSLTAAFGTTGHGGYLFTLRASANVHFGLVDNYGSDGSNLTTGISSSESVQTFSRSVTSSTTTSQRRHITGIVEVLTANTVLSIEFSQNTLITQPEPPATPITISTRKRAHLIARRIA
jgi:hypothetical protein